MELSLWIYTYYASMSNVYKMSSFLYRDLEIRCYEKAEARYLSLNELGDILKILSSSHTGTCYVCTCGRFAGICLFQSNSWYTYVMHKPYIALTAAVQHPRTFRSTIFKVGSPNLLIVPAGMHVKLIFGILLLCTQKPSWSISTPQHS